MTNPDAVSEDSGWCDPTKNNDFDDVTTSHRQWSPPKRSARTRRCRCRAAAAPPSTARLLLLPLVLRALWCGLASRSNDGGSMYGSYRHVHALKPVSLSPRIRQIPARIRTTARGQPRLTSLVEGLLTVGARVAWGSFRHGPQTAITVEAHSNRAILQGELSKVDVRVTHGRGRLFPMEEFALRGSQLHLGWWPTLVLAAAPMALLLLRPSLQTILLLLVAAGYFRNRTSQSRSRRVPSKLSKTSSSLWHKITDRLHGSPCALDYELTVTDQTLTDSWMMQYVLRSILRSLMLNSVLGVAAATADTTIAVLQRQEPLSSSWENYNRWSSPRRDLSLPSNQQQRLSISTTPPFGDRLQQPKVALTKLLQATDFRLTRASLAGSHLYLYADAVLPDGTGQTRLSYTLRVRPQPTVWSNNYDNKQAALAFETPECQFSLGAGAPWEGLLPDLWLPVGPGVALPLAGPWSSHSIRHVDVSDGRCRLRGRFAFYKNANPTGLVSRYLKFVRHNGKRESPPWLARAQKLLPKP